MVPLPKRKHSTQRKGKRITSKKATLGNLVKCKACGKMKKAHRVCKYCKK